MKRMWALGFVAIFLVLGLVASTAVAEDKEKSDWMLNATIFAWRKYVTSSGFIASPNFSFQPEFTLQHKSGLYLNEWASFDMKKVEPTEVDHIFGYRFEPFGSFKADVGGAFYQLFSSSDQVSPFARIEKTFKLFGDLTLFVKTEAPYELSSGRISSWSYVGVKYVFPITNKLGLAVLPQFVEGYDFDRNWSTEFAVDILFAIEITKNVSIGPALKFRTPVEIPGGDPRKTLWIPGAFVTGNF